MIGIVCLDEKGGMQFRGRRQSRDREVIKRIAEQCGEHRLWMHPGSAVLFAEQEEITVCTDQHFLEKAGKGDYCFVEDQPLLPVAGRIEELIVYWWNRNYPSDRKLDLDLSAWKQVSREDFAGYSHEKITEEVYRP